MEQEEEIERVVAPESAVEEEERLRREREAAAAAAQVSKGRTSTFFLCEDRSFHQGAAFCRVMHPTDHNATRKRERISF